MTQQTGRASNSPTERTPSATAPSQRNVLEPVGRTFRTHRERTAERRAEYEEEAEYVDGFLNNDNINRTSARV